MNLVFFSGETAATRETIKMGTVRTAMFFYGRPLKHGADLDVGGNG